MGVGAHDDLAGGAQALLRQEGVLHTHLSHIEEIGDLMFVGKISGFKAQLRGFDVLAGGIVVQNNGDLIPVKNPGKAGLFKLGDRHRGGDVVAQHHIHPGLDELSHLHSIQSGVLGQDLLCHCHSHIKNLLSAIPFACLTVCQSPCQKNVNYVTIYKIYLRGVSPMDLSLDFPSQLWAPFALSRPPIRCSAGYLIYLQNTEATCFYYLKSGRVKSYIQSADGAERVLNIYPAGSLFGEASFFDELPRVSSAVALSPCELVPIDRELAAQAVSRDPELALSMMKYLARTVRLLSEQLDAMAFRPAEWRIARYLLSLSPSGGPVQCTQEDIAAAVSVSRVTVSRILNRWARSDTVALQYRSILLRDPAALEQLCRV